MLSSFTKLHRSLLRLCPLKFFNISTLRKNAKRVKQKYTDKMYPKGRQRRGDESCWEPLARVKEVLTVMCNDKSRRNRHSRWTVTVHRGTSGFWSRGPHFLAALWPLFNVRLPIRRLHCARATRQISISGTRARFRVTRLWLFKRSPIEPGRRCTRRLGTPAAKENLQLDKFQLSAVPIFLPELNY